MEKDFYSLAKLKQKDRDFKAAFEFYQKALEIEPYNADILSDAGVCLFNLDRKKEALDYLDKAANLDPKNSFRYSSRGFIKASLGDIMGGIEDYKRCIELDPEDAVAYNNLGMLEEQLGYKEQAQKSFEKADELSKLLEDNNIVLESSLEKEKNSEIDVKDEVIIEETKEVNSVSIIKQIFTSKNTFSEFISFIKNGFKLKK